MRVVVLFVLATLAAPASAAAPSMVVMPFHVENLASNEAQRLEAAMRQRAASLGGYDVQSDATTTQLVEATQALGLDCDVNALECGVKIGKIADAKFILITRAVGGLDSGIGLDASIIDVTKAELVRRATALVPADPDKQPIAMGAYAALLFSSAPLASLPLSVDPAGAEVVVDGAVRGVSPLASPLDHLAPGEHFVDVHKKGFLPERRRVSVKPSDTAQVQIVLKVDPEAVRTTGDPTIPLVIAGGGALVFVAGGIVAIAGYTTYAQFQNGVATVNGVHADTKAKLEQSDVNTIIDGHKEAEAGAQAWNDWGRLAFVGGLVGASVGLVTGAAGAAWGLVELNSSGEPADAAPQRVQAAPPK